MTIEPMVPPAGLRELGVLLRPTGLAQLPPDPQWAAAVHLGLRHGLGPAMLPRMVEIEAPAELAPLLPLLRRVGIGAAIIARRIQDDAAAVLGVLAGAGVEVIALKGLHLVAGGYASPGTRTMGDIDLLVRPEQAWTAWSALRRDGFVPAQEIDEGQVARFKLHLPVLMKPDATPVEIHREITSPLLSTRISVDGLWRRSRPLAVGPNAIRALSPEDLLLHLCVHATHQHRCQVPLRNIHDIALVIHRTPGGIEWQALLRISRESGTDRPLFCGLALAEEVFGAAVPDDVLRALGPVEGRAELLAWAMDAVLHFDTPAGPLARYRVARGSLPRRIAQAARELFASPKTIATTTQRGSLFTRLRAYGGLFARVVARDRAFAARLATGDPAARAEMRAAEAVAAIEAWMEV